MVIPLPSTRMGHRCDAAFEPGGFDGQLVEHGVLRLVEREVARALRSGQDRPHREQRVRDQDRLCRDHQRVRQEIASVRGSGGIERRAGCPVSRSVISRSSQVSTGWPSLRDVSRARACRRGHSRGPVWPWSRLSTIRYLQDQVSNERRRLRIERCRRGRGCFHGPPSKIMTGITTLGSDAASQLQGSYAQRARALSDLWSLAPTGITH